MNELQCSLLDIFKWFHSFCQTHGLRYYMLGGTMLGAVRHEGFIPWDDDIDIGMPRSDYKRLAELMQAHPEKHFVLETPQTKNDDYFYPFSKIYDTRTTLIENTRVKIKRGIYLDVFPLDGIGNTEDESKKNYRDIYHRYNLLLARVTGIRKGRSPLKNAAVMALRAVPSVILNNKRLLLKLDAICEKYSFDQCAWVGNMVGAWRFKEVMPRTVFGNPTEYKFEDQLFWGPEKGTEYLSLLYGEWRKLPPKEKQVSHHDYIECDLQKSYLE